MKGNAHEDRARIPRLARELTAAAMRELPLTPLDGFILSRIDGTLNEADLAQATGLEEAAVSEALRKLEQLGVIRYEGGAPTSSPSGTFTRTASPAREPASEAVRAPATSQVDVITAKEDAKQDAKGDEGVELEPEHRARIEDLHQRLDGIDHYALLGTPRDADRKAIKRSYYELAALFHPDRFFRKNLGRYKQKMEAIFARVTTAHDVLTSKEDRAEYDAYLADVERSRAVEASIAEAAPAAAARESASPPPAVPTANASPAPPVIQPVIQVTPPAQTTPRSPGLDAQTRRDALARRLLANRAGGATFPPPAPAPAQAPGDPLKRQYDERMGATRGAVVRRHTDAATAAMARGDIASAVREYKKAKEFAPDDPTVAKSLEEASRAAEDALADTYERQARYEEKNAQWSGAASSWGKLAELRTNDPNAQERAAHAILQAKGDLHRAANFGRRAVELRPNDPVSRVSLANVYLAAGLPKSARRELEAAQQLSPEDASIALLLKRVGH